MATDAFVIVFTLYDCLLIYAMYIAHKQQRVFLWKKAIVFAIGLYAIGAITQLWTWNVISPGLNDIKKWIVYILGG